MIRKLLVRYSNKFVSRWLILLFDLGTTAIAFGVAYILRFNFDYFQIDVKEFNLHLLLALVVYGIGYLIFKPFAGIIRHTSLEDVFKLINGALFGSGLLLGVTLLMRIEPGLGWLQIPISIIVIHFVFTLALLISSRFFIKTFYHNILKKASYKYNILIYGAGSTGILTKHALGQEQNKEFNIVGFIDDNPTKQGKSIEGVPVLSSEKVDADYLERKSIHEVILAIHNIHPSRKKEIIDNFLAFDVRIKNVPKVEQWINGSFSPRQIKQVDIEDLLERDPINLNNPTVYEQNHERQIMVTGAAGSIGSEIARQLMHYHPAKLILVDQAESALYGLEMELNKSFSDAPARCEYIVTDICNRERMAKLMEAKQPQAIYHAAAYKHVPLMEANPYEAIKVNVIGTKILADLACDFGVDNFVYVSTDKAVNPTNVMGATKRAAEIYIRGLTGWCESNVLFTITRFGNVLGSNGSVIPVFQRQIDEGGPVTVTDKDITRYFMTIPEACQLVLEAGTMGEGGEIFVFDMGEPVKIIDIARKMIRLSGLELGKDIDIEITGLRPGEKLYEEVLSDGENTKDTYHPKIRIAQVRKVKSHEIKSMMDALEDLLQEQDDFMLVNQLKQIVPEFKSRNSKFERLDERLRS